MINIEFENIDEIELPQNAELWLKNAIEIEGFKVGEINYILCDDAYLLKINQDFLQHDYYTDIITFNYVKGKTISGDIFVSLPRIFENAKIWNTHNEEEILRVLVHGILHLCGFNDKTLGEEQQMRLKENEHLAIYKSNFLY
jgi:probable rRNA maturation factor